MKNVIFKTLLFFTVIQLKAELVVNHTHLHTLNVHKVNHLLDQSKKKKEKERKKEEAIK